MTPQHYFWSNKFPIYQNSFMNICHSLPSICLAFNLIAADMGWPNAVCPMGLISVLVSPNWETVPNKSQAFRSYF